MVYIDNQLFAYSHPDSSKYLRKTHLAADDDQGKYFPSVAEVEQVDDAKEDLKDDGRGGGDEVHCLSPKVVDVLGHKKSRYKPEDSFTAYLCLSHQPYNSHDNCRPIGILVDPLTIY